jgi:transcription antitermination protein NusB
MPNPRDIRRLAMQVLYQIDVSGQAGEDALRESLAEGPDSIPVKERALELAQAAWARHAEADALVAELAPKWPTHRQPPVDRAILRLAYHEIASGVTPGKVAINEAIELAKEFSAEQSPPFINGVLDKIAKRVTPPATAPGSESGSGIAPQSDDAWLKDALRDNPADTPPVG